MQAKKYLKFLMSPCFLVVNLVTAQPKLLVAVQQYRDSVFIYNLNIHAKIGQVKIGFKPHEITYDPVSKTCFVSNFGLEDYDLKIGKTGNLISVIDPFKGKLVQNIYTSADTTIHNGPHGVKVRPGKSRELFVNVEIGGDILLVYDLNSLAIKRKCALPPGTHNFAFSDDGKTLWLMAGQNGVYTINPEDGKVLQHRQLSSPIRGLMVAKKFLLASGKNEVFLLSKTDLSIIKHFSNLGTGQLLYSNITNNQKYIIAPAAFDNVVLVIDAETGEVLHRLQTGGAPLNVQVTDKVAYITHARDGHIATVDLQTFAFTKDIAAFGANGMVLVGE